jgi:RNA polymerase-binding transcription factor DksA
MELGPGIKEMLRRMLRKKRKELFERIEEAERGAKAHLKEFSVHANRHTTDSVILPNIHASLSIQLMEELERCNKAFELLEQGEYGTCLDCGEPIPIARLEREPLAVQCVSCKAQSEKLIPGAKTIRNHPHIF